MSQTLPDLGAIIYIAVKPLIKFSLPVAFGFWLTRNGMFPLAASKGAGQLCLNVLIPSLLFQKIVIAINTSNVSAFGPLILVGVLYEIFGLCIGWIIRLLFPVPRNFRNGLLVAGILGNWGDLPFAILQTITVSAPFNSAIDPSLSQAYACVFIVIFIVTTFPLRVILLVARDYIEPISSEPTHPPLARWLARLTRRSTKREEPASQADTDISPDEAKYTDHPETPAAVGTTSALPEFPPLTQQQTSRSIRSHHSSLAHDASAAAGAEPYSLLRRFRRFRAPTVHEDIEEPTRPSTPVLEHNRTRTSEKAQTPATGVDEKNGRRRWQEVIAHETWAFLRALITPPTLSLVASLVIALVKPLKALFVEVPGYELHKAPDGLPVLDVVYQVASFMGNAAVPVSLTILGAALSRIEVPRPISKLPLRAIIALAIGRLAILPILGVAIVQGLTYHTSLISPSNHVLRFTAILVSCVPSATSQLVLTVVVAPPDVESNADLFGCFLLAQYAVLIIALPIVAAYSLTLIFH